MTKENVMWATSREQQVLELLLQGFTNKEIALHLDISGYTVRDHVSSLLRRNEVKTRFELMARCVSRHVAWGAILPPTSVGLCGDNIRR
jgi:DNA-binding NarL/FixJ family response regulator